MRIGSAEAPAILFLAPLFEEANRTRHFLIETMRALGRRGFCCYLPDLPGTLESLTPLETLTWQDWEQALGAVAAAIGRPFHVVSLRGGALLDGAIDALGRWRLSPPTGEALLRELVRIRVAADREAGESTTTAQREAEALSAPFEVAGYRLNPALLAGLKAETPREGDMTRTVRRATDPLPADRYIDATPLWRKSEPTHDPVLCQIVTDDIANWISTCNAAG